LHDNVIEVHDLHKTYRDGLFGRRKVHALDGASLNVRPGEVFSLLGPNGAGKTTLVKILLGIVRKSNGSARMLGAPVGTRRIRRLVGYLPENHRIPRHLTGNSALEFYGALSGLSLREIKRRRPKLLEIVGLQKWAQTSVGKYSKGMQQRLGLAQAILHDPELVVLDEPTDGVDPVGRSEIRTILKQLQEQGTTIFLNSHLLQEVELISNRVAILDRGQVRRVAAIEELTRDETEFVFGLEGSEEHVRRALPSEIIRDWKSAENGHQVVVKTQSPSDVDRLIDRLRAEGIGIRSLGKRRSSLEEAFIKIIQEGQRS
jgi:ABC-2 type transport system ATP-binding protein